MLLVGYKSVVSIQYLGYISHAYTVQQLKYLRFYIFTRYGIYIGIRYLIALAGICYDLFIFLSQPVIIGTDPVYDKLRGAASDILSGSLKALCKPEYKSILIISGAFAYDALGGYGLIDSFCFIYLSLEKSKACRLRNII